MTDDEKLVARIQSLESRYSALLETSVFLRAQVVALESGVNPQAAPDVANRVIATEAVAKNLDLFASGDGSMDRDLRHVVSTVLRDPAAKHLAPQTQTSDTPAAKTKPTPQTKAKMSASDKAQYIATHGLESFMALPQE